MSTIYVAYFEPPDDELELFVSAHRTKASARQACEDDARDAGKEGWRWGNGQPREGATEDPELFSNWDAEDERGYYVVRPEPVHGELLPATEDTAISIGMRLAREVFASRGNHTEAHLSETELAALLALAAQQTMEATRG